MALVVVTRPVVGAVTDASDVNNTFTSWNSASADIDAINFRDEAFDRRVVPSRVVTPADGRAKVSTAVAVVVASVSPDPAWTTVLTLGPINSSAAGDMVIIRANFDYQVQARLTSGDIISLRLESSTDGVVWTAVSRTLREFRYFGNGPATDVVDERGSHTIVHRGTIANAAVQYRLVAQKDDAAGTVTVPRSSMIAKVFAK